MSSVALPDNATIAELALALEERSAVLQIHRSPGAVWTVLLYAPEDPHAAFVVSHEQSLFKAILAALDVWDKTDVNVLPS